MSSDALSKKGFSRRKFVALTGGAIVASGILAACGDATNTSAPAATTAASGAATTAAGAATTAASGTATTAAAASGDKITLSHWYHQYGEDGTQNAALKYASDYSKVNPNVTVKVEWIPGDYDSKLNAALLTPEGPDIYEGHLTNSMVQAGQVAPLDDLFTDDIKKDFDKVALARNTVDGKVYGVQMIIDPQLFYYRKSMLDKAGLKVPTTMDELINASKALNSGKVKGLFMGNDGGLGILAGNLVYAAGASYLDSSNKPAFNTDAVAAAWAQGKTLANSGTLLVGAPTDWWDPSAFNQNLSAMTWNGLWAMPGITKALADDFGVFPFPSAGPSGKQVVYSGGWAEFVNPKTKNLQAAKDYVNWLWLKSADKQQDWSLSYGFHIPPRISTAASADKLKSGPAAEVVSLTGKLGYGDLTIWNSAMGQALSDAFTNVVQKNADPKAELAAAQTKVQAELDKVLKK
ncbi:MAG: sugar ABC transporter substrate-binding protein [Chloroflexi bacterium]|nr:sugar ABC transporter substrate-binding protein [Chloroflexota bacterium]